MIKKILGAILIVIVLTGLPFLVMANPCVSGDLDYDPAVCNAYGDMVDNSAVQSGAGTVGGSGSVSGMGTVGGVPAGGTPLGVSGVKIENPIKFNTFSGFVAQVTKTAVDILMPFVVLAFVWSGFLFVRAQGNEKELEEAKSAIKWSVIGAFILLGAWGFAQIIGTTIKTITN